MKALVFNCKEVSWGQPKIDIETKQRTSCLLVFVCCEERDSDKELKETVRRIKQLNQKRFNRKNIVIFPFAHLSNEIMQKDKAFDFISRFSSLLKNDMGIEIACLPFNQEKGVAINLLEKNEDVSFISY